MAATTEQNYIEKRLHIADTSEKERVNLKTPNQLVTDPH